jgi:hypothetical protein
MSTEPKKLSAVGQWLFGLFVIFYLCTFSALCLGVAAIVVWACRSIEIPQRLGERWVFIVALVPIPFGALFYAVTRPRRLSKAVRDYLLRKCS